MGLATAKLFLDLGASVYGVDMSKRPTELAYIPAFDFLQIDLCQMGALQRVVRECSQAFRRSCGCSALLSIAGMMDTSKAGISGSAAGVAYTASKQGIVGLTKNVAFRFRYQKIRCNAICPGGTYKSVYFVPDGQAHRVSSDLGFTTNIMQSIDHTQIDQESTKLISPSSSFTKMGT
ncbi:hypothetical protein AYL99_01972 [Fonsecaea erecta]|uniref:Uncharacterized protein n=1 Tax=Fonsecaea erecta TaxID=1367422 RepID=A0A178ZUJ4_9EURO|nr:hypothetical protein AYL99_01972 [Fonsecaea erecta]OAP62745.1 hypothetical protein AYL99_01972 [Fonsecaea erecta]